MFLGCGNKAELKPPRRLTGRNFRRRQAPWRSTLKSLCRSARTCHLLLKLSDCQLSLGSQTLNERHAAVELTSRDLQKTWVGCPHLVSMSPPGFNEMQFGRRGPRPTLYSRRGCHHQCPTRLLQPSEPARCTSSPISMYWRPLGPLEVPL